MSIRMDRTKMNKILGLVESIKSGTSDVQVINMTKIVERCIDIVDDIQEDNLFLTEENERLKFEAADKHFERQRGNTRRR
jgi:hypothetical protein